MAIARNQNNTKVGTRPSAGREELLSSNISKAGISRNNTAKQSYTSIRYGNDHGSISFGHVHKQGDVIADVLIQASDARHGIVLDKDGPREKCTQITAPNRISIECGEDKTESEDTLFIHSWHGNICIVASDGKLRLQGTDIEMIAVGEGGSKGNIRMKATGGSIELDAKKVLLNSSSLCKIASSGKVELAANSCLSMYGSIIQGVTDACALKDSKVGGRNFQVNQIKV